MNERESFQRLYPAQETIIFDGGIDTKFPKDLIPENESPDCLNVEFTDGAVGTRQGAVKLNTTAAGTNPFDGLYTRRASDGSETMCAFINGHMLTFGGVSFNTVPSAQSVFTIGFRVGADMAEDKLFMGNGGVSFPYKWDGTYFTRHGVTPPTQTATVASSPTAGCLATGGIYMWKYTFINTALVESDLGPAVTFTVGNSGSVFVSSIASGDTFLSWGINGRRLYRTSANGSTFFRVTAFNEVTTNLYEDKLADSALGTQAPTDNGMPPRYNAICYAHNILFCNDVDNPNYVWHSTIGQPYTYPSTNFFKVGDKSGDLVKGFAAYDNYVVIFCENSTWINFMPNPADSSGWRRLKTNSPYGSRSAYCNLSCDVRGQNVLLHPAVQNKKFAGFAALKGAEIDPSVSYQAVTVAGSNLQSQVIEPDMFLVQETYLKHITGIVYKNRAFVSLTYGSGQTTNNRIYVWDYSPSNLNKTQIASWVPWSGTGHSIQQFTIYDGKLYGASATSNGFVYRLADTGVYNDDGAAIDSYWWSKEFAGYAEDTNVTKDFRYLNILVDNAGSYSMNLVYRTDSDTGSGLAIPLDLSPGGSLWGTMVWGVDNWGGGVDQTEVRVYLGGSVRGKRLQFRFDNQNTVNQRFKVYHAQMRYNARGYR